MKYEKMIPALASVMAAAAMAVAGCGGSSGAFPVTYKGTLTVVTNGDWERLAGDWEMSCRAVYIFENATLRLESGGTLTFTAPQLPYDGIAYPNFYYPNCQDAVEWVKLRIAAQTDRGTHDGSGAFSFERIFRGCHSWGPDSTVIYRSITEKGTFTGEIAEFHGEASCRLEEPNQPGVWLAETDSFTGTAVR